MSIKLSTIKSNPNNPRIIKDEKFNAIAGIRRYDNWLRLQKGIAKMLPDTYLYQKRWLDEF